MNLLYVANPNRSSKMPVTVTLGGVDKAVLVDQRKRDGAGKSLGTWPIEGSVTVTVSNRDTDGFVVVDGVQLLPKP